MDSIVFVVIAILYIQTLNNGKAVKMKDLKPMKSLRQVNVEQAQTLEACNFYFYIKLEDSIFPSIIQFPHNLEK